MLKILICCVKKYEKEIITSDNDKFYYIESCKKDYLVNLVILNYLLVKVSPFILLIIKYLTDFQMGQISKSRKEAMSP